MGEPAALRVPRKCINKTMRALSQQAFLKETAALRCRPSPQSKPGLALARADHDSLPISTVAHPSEEIPGSVLRVLVTRPSEGRRSQPVTGR
jgi:hypothetical protein